MAENSKIQWTDHTFNPWVGCQKISPACEHCYAEAWAKRTGQAGLWRGVRRRTSEANWKLPLKWNREAAAQGIRKRVFCASLADVFEDHEAIQPGWRADLGSLILATPCLDWLLLTKRPETVYRMMPDFWVHFSEPYALPQNVWIGTTVENQEYANKRIPDLLKIPARVRFLSVEPMLGAIDLHRIQDGDGFTFDSLSSKHGIGLTVRFNGHSVGNLAETIHWVIAGGESGAQARHSRMEWFRSLRDQCRRARVPFFMKQLGKLAGKERGCKDSHGGDFAEFPADLQIREIPR